VNRPSRGARPTRAPHVQTIVVGAGQAGLALSFYLTAAGHEHLVLDRGRVGQRWRERWDSLTLLSPNWMNQLPGAPAHENQDGFLGRSEFVDYLRSYARSFGAPLLEGTDVERVERRDGNYHVRTTKGSWTAHNVVLATGDAAQPQIPLAAPPGVRALHSSEYRRPDSLPSGRILVVGAGASGQQIALELAQAGRDVAIAVGRHSRAPRRFRGRDIFAWLNVLGDFDRTIDELPDVEAAKRVPLFPVSGANGGEDLGLDRLAGSGITISGRLRGFDRKHALFADDLADNVAAANARLRKLVRRIDPAARVDELRLEPGPRTLGLDDVGAIIWATGYRRAYPWLDVPGVLDDRGEVVQRRGVTRIRGIYVLGLAYQYRRSSHFIGGVGRDAETLAGQLVGARTRAFDRTLASPVRGAA